MVLHTTFRKLALLAAPLVLIPQFAAASHYGRMYANAMRFRAAPDGDNGSPGNVALPPDEPVISRNGTVLPFYSTIYHFDQLIDHDNPSRGTFKQRFWFTSEFYEPGGPMILFTPGEGSADTSYGYLTNRTMNGQIAQQQNGSTIVLEHRFYGLSNPFPDLSVESLEVHTLQQAIDDYVYFANNVVLPMPGGDQVKPDQAPWILMGRSYAAALVAWTMVNKPGVFYAGYSSSGVVQAIFNFWRIYDPVLENMPQNCSTDVQAAITHIDKVFMDTNTTAIQDIKESFGMGEVTHLDDIGSALQIIIADWQAMDVTTGAGSDFYRFCDALEVKNGTNAPASGWGLDHALAAWGSYFKNVFNKEICGNTNVGQCYDTYNISDPIWTDTSVDNANRSWMWIVCNEVGYLQTGAPVGYPTLVSRLVQPAYTLRQCQQLFPGKFSEIPTTINTNRTNKVYKGWDVKVDRLFFGTGTRDVWRGATMSTEQRDIQSTDLQPIVLADGFHGSDIITRNGVDPTILALQKQALAYMSTWLSTWKPNASSV